MVVYLSLHSSAGLRSWMMVSSDPKKIVGSYQTCCIIINFKPKLFGQMVSKFDEFVTSSQFEQILRFDVS